MTAPGENSRTARLYISDLEKIQERIAVKEETVADYVRYLLAFHDRESDRRRTFRILEELDEDIRNLKKIRALLEGGGIDEG